MERIKVNKEKNEVSLSFNENFYDKKFIDEAIKDFEKVCDVKIDKNIILLKPKEKTDLDTLGFEFYNYVLGLIKNS